MVAYTPQLAVVEVDQTQNNKYLTINTALAALDGVLNKLLESNTTGHWALTETQFTTYGVFKALGRAAAFNITIPDATNISNRERVFIVWNADTTYTATVQTATAPGTTVALLPGQIAVLYQDDVDVVALLWVKQGSSPTLYDIGFFISGAPTNSQMVLRFKAPRAFILPGNASGSKGTVGTNPTSTAAFDVLKNGSSIGSISVSTGGVFTFTTTSGNPVSFAVDDILAIVAPTSADATMADIGVVFVMTRT